MQPKPKIGKLFISSKKAIISIKEGEYEETKYKLTSGIAGKHHKGGQSQKRFLKKREEAIDRFFKRVIKYMTTLEVEKWEYDGDKVIIKRIANEM